VSTACPMKEVLAAASTSTMNHPAMRLPDNGYYACHLNSVRRCFVRNLLGVASRHCG
jgi:hypothetical protein